MNPMNPVKPTKIEKSEKLVETNTTNKPCLAQVPQPPVNLTVKPMGDCCTNIVQNVNPISLHMKEIRATILKGVVNCKDSSTGVEGVIVVATSHNGKHYVGVTNKQGQYSICVPAVNRDESYSVEAYCCSTCSGTVCTDAPCDCGCK